MDNLAGFSYLPLLTLANLALVCLALVCDLAWDSNALMYFNLMVLALVFNYGHGAWISGVGALYTDRFPPGGTDAACADCRWVLTLPWISLDTPWIANAMLAQHLTRRWTYGWVPACLNNNGCKPRGFSVVASLLGVDISARSLAAWNRCAALALPSLPPLMLPALYLIWTRSNWTVLPVLAPNLMYRGSSPYQQQHARLMPSATPCPWLWISALYGLTPVWLVRNLLAAYVTILWFSPLRSNCIAPCPHRLQP